MKNEYIQIVKTLFEKPLNFLKLDTPQVYKNMTVIPIILQDNKFIDFISIKEAEELELIDIIETDIVGQLEVINKSDKQILIPFGMTVHGGKQDRTIWEPILLPVGGKQNIKSQNPKTVKQKYVVPAKCVEQSRWTYTKGHGFKTSNTRLHPNVAYEAISASGQGAVWNEIQSHRAEMNYALSVAPTQNYIEMTKQSDQQTENMIKNFKSVNNQCGIAVFINGEFMGLEFYANPEAWNSMSSDILKAFSIEGLRFKDEHSQKVVEYHQEIIKILQNLKFDYSHREGVALGNVVEFNSDNKKWRGIALVHEQSMAQFYLVSKRGGYQEYHQNSNIQFQTIINQRYRI
ncbi:MAG: ARPP-1 family domain-containing protein [Candidatus Thorarchaeota archaeon]